MTAEQDPELHLQAQDASAAAASELPPPKGDEAHTPPAGSTLLTMFPPLVAVGPTPSTDGQQSGPGPLFLSLFLVVLAFFIVLAAISQPRSEWSRSILDSLSRTFAPHAEPGQRAGQPDGLDAPGAPEVVLSQRLEALLAEDLAIVDVGRSREGRRLEVTLPESALFAVGEARLRASVAPLMGRVVDAVASSSAYVQTAARFVAHVRLDREGRLPAGSEQLAFARAAAVADALSAGGGLGGELTVGVEAGDPGLATFTFYLSRLAPSKATEPELAP